LFVASFWSRCASLESRKTMLLSSVEHIRSLWDNSEHSDVRLLILGKEYKLHKTILLQSPFFSAAFSERWKILDQAGEPFTLDLEDVDCSSTTVEKVFKTMYGFELNINTFQEGIEVHNLASFLQLEEMASAAVEKSCQLVSVETAVEFFNQMENQCVHPGLINLEKKCRQKLFLEGFSRPDLLAQVYCLEEILQHDSFMVYGGEYERALLIEEIIKAKGTVLDENGENRAKRARTDERDTDTFNSTLRRCCFRLEFLTMKQFPTLSSQSRLESDLDACFWRRLCIQSVLSINSDPKAADYPDLRPYRQYIKFKKPASGTRSSAEAFDAYGSSWTAFSDWMEEKSIIFNIVRNLPSDKELYDHQNNRKFDYDLRIVNVSNPTCGIKRSAIQFKHKESVLLARLSSEKVPWSKCVHNDSVSFSLHIIPHLE